MKRPIVIEFSGLPNSGKTTLLHGLKARLDCNNVNAIIIQEQAELLPKVIPKGSIEQNLWITFRTMQKSLEVKNISDADYIFIDRGFYDQYFWVNMYAQRDKEYSDFVLSFMDEFAKRYFVKPDYLYVVDVEVEESIKRRLKIGNEVTFSKKEFLENYKKQFYDFYNQIPNTFYINTTSLSKEQVVDNVFNKIIAL